MESDGVGSLELLTANGQVMPGLDKVIFAKTVSDKLISVGGMCDNGLVCVFDKECLTTYKENDFKAQGVIFSRDARDLKSRLYPMKLFRPCAGSAIDVLEPTQVLAKYVHGQESMDWSDMPGMVTDDQVQTLLAHVYVKPGLSEVDRYHAKLGDIGSAAMRKAVPHLKPPWLQVRMLYRI